jgi:tetratricopeptide (TPR) repeat protein
MASPTAPMASDLAPGVLAGNARAQKDPDPKEVDPGIVLSQAAVDGLGEVERAKGASTSSTSFWTSIATLYALAGRMEEFARAATRALESGSEPPAVLGMVAALPSDRRLPALAALLAAAPERPWDVLELAKIHAGADDVAGAYAILAKDANPQRDLSDVVSEMVRADPQGAASLLLNGTPRLTLDSKTLLRAASILFEGDHKDLAATFVERAKQAGATTAAVLEVLTRSDPTAAAALAESSVATNPKDSVTWGRLAALRLKAGDKAGAFAAYREAALLAPGEEDYAKGLFRADPQGALPVLVEVAKASTNDEVLGLVARAYLANGRVKEALDQYERAHEADPHDYSWLRGMVALDPARAADHLAALVRDPRMANDDEIVGAYANALVETGHRAEAFDRYLQAHRRDSSDLEWLRGLAKSDPMRAEPFIEEYAKQKPDSDDVEGLRGEIYAGLGRRADAIAAFERCLQKDPDDESWMVALSQVAPERGLAMLEGVVQKKPEDGDAWGYLARAYKGLGRMAEAKAAYDKAVEDDPLDSDWAQERASLRAP